MNKMVTSRRVAFVQIQASEFQKSCLPYPTVVVDVVSKWLPVIANRLNDELMTVIKVNMYTNIIFMKISMGKCVVSYSSLLPVSPVNVMLVRDTCSKPWCILHEYC